jgi:nicotinate-nucleotide adenylyltransferase
MSARRTLGVLGGTFDPVHLGHLDATEAARTALGLDEIRLIPSWDPPHRAGHPRASAFHRFALVALAIDGRPGYHASDMELLRSGPSYTIDSLRALHAEGWQPSQLFFILGADAFAEIATWRAFPDVLDAANFVVAARPGTSPASAIARVPGLGARLGDPAAAGEGRPTRVVALQARTRDISSTMIRERIAARVAIDDLVPPSVARHILTHHLYER